MTYSETREMYTSFYAESRREREKRTGLLLNALKLLYSWFLPWLITSLCIVRVHNLLNAKGFLLSFVILGLSLPFYSSASNSDRTYFLSCTILSYLIALSSVLTVLM